MSKFSQALSTILNPYVLLTALVSLEMAELEVFSLGVLHHALDALVFAGIFIALRLLGTKRAALTIFTSGALIAWTLDLAHFQWRVLDIEGVFWLIAHASMAWSLAVSLFSRAKVTSREIVGAICLFLTMGLLFANIYGLILFSRPNALIAANTAPLTYDQVLYYSFMTQATVGYGDVVPGNSLTRLVTVVQAVSGVMYISVLIAWFVSANLAQRNESISKGQGQ